MKSRPEFRVSGFWGVLLIAFCLSPGLSAGENEAASKPAASSGNDTAQELKELRSMILEQKRQIDELRRALEDQKKNAGEVAAIQPAASQPESPAYRKLGEVASTTPMLPPPAPAPLSPPVAMQAPAAGAQEVVSPLQFRLGSAYFMPVGFMDFTTVVRDTAPGSNIGTSFGSFPYRTPAAVNSNLSEFRFSPQNSRIGMRVDALVKGAKVLGYWESDFLGGINNPPVGNLAVSSNSYPLRLRLFWVDVRKDKWEILGGQTWSLVTPGRKGISPLPGDLFYSNDIDVNYQAGLAWGRIPEFRFVYHASDKVTAAFALDNPEQYMGGSAGGSAPTLPNNLSGVYTNAELNNGGSTLNVPNLHPDIIGKVAFDPSPKFHFEFGGLERTFKVYNPLTQQKFTTAGGAGFVNLNGELTKGLRLVVNTYIGNGGGRYIFGQAPDVIVNGDGSLSNVYAMSTVDGLEYTRKNTLFYTYYGGIYIDKNVVLDPSNSNKPIGYGYSGSPNSQNRTVQEITFGFTQTFWKDPKFGALAFMGQYSYFTRNPWYVAAGAPTHAYMNEVWLNLRYTLPGGAPSLK